jgi:hypothetical protein
LEARRGYWKAVVAIAAKNARMCWAMLARGWQKAVVALANKNARILWAVMTRGDAFDADHLSLKPGTT